MKTDELKPCPMCASEKVFIQNSDVRRRGTDNEWLPIVWCSSCGLRTREYEDDAKAIEAWNTRITSIPALSGEVVERVARAIFDAQHPTSDPVVREQYCQSSRYKRAARAAIAAISSGGGS